MNDYEIKLFIELFPNSTNKYLIDKFNISNYELNKLRKKFSLKKDSTYLLNKKKEILNYRNKNILGRNLTNEFLKEIALKYESKTEFYNKDSSAYVTARNRGILKAITKHMVKKIISTPELIIESIFKNLFKVDFYRNNRRVIKPYELDFYFMENSLAIEYDGKGWHVDDKIDKYKLCENKGIYLIKLVEKNRKYWKDIKEQLIENLEIINNLLKTDITASDLINFEEVIEFPKLFTDDELHILRNNEVSYLRKNYNNLYNRYVKYNPDGKIFKKSKYTEEYIKNEIKKYNSVREIYKIDKNLYQAIHRKFRHLIVNHERKVICINDGMLFKNTKEVSDYYGIKRSYILRVLNGTRKKVSNLVFKYND